MKSLLLWAACLLCVGVAWADDRVEPSRLDVAHSFLTFEQAIDDHPPAGDLVAFNRRFDWLTHLIFRGQWVRASEEIAALTDELLPVTLRSPAERAARATLVRATPDVAAGGSDVTISLGPAFDVPNRPEALLVEVRDGETVTYRRWFDASGDAVVWSPPARTATYTLHVAADAGSTPWRRGRVSVIADEPEVVRAELVRQLDAASIPQPLAAAAAGLRARLDLLRADGDPRRPVPLVGGVAELVADLTREVEQLARGVDPYAGKPGTYWTTLAGVPAVLHVPAGDGPFPVVYALHGAGGDENLFILGYGAGRLKSLADEHGFLLVSVRTYPLLGRGDLVRAMTDELAGRYPINASRVYALGHSLGAITLAGWTLADRSGPANDVLAGVALIAGGGMPSAGPVARAVPTLVVAAGHDRIFRPARLAAIRDAVAASGVAADYMLYPDEAHVSIVRASLNDVVAWLLARERDAA